MEEAVSISNECGPLYPHWEDSQTGNDMRGHGTAHLTILRRTMPTLEALALRKPGHENVTSLRDDMAQPPMIGSSDAHTASGGYAWPSSGADSSTENTCHHDLAS